MLLVTFSFIHTFSLLYSSIVRILQVPLPRIPSKSHLIVQESRSQKLGSGPPGVSMATNTTMEGQEVSDPGASQMESSQSLAAPRFHIYEEGGHFNITITDDAGNVVHVGTIDGSQSRSSHMTSDSAAAASSQVDESNENDDLVVDLTSSKSRQNAEQKLVPVGRFQERDTVTGIGRETGPVTSIPKQVDQEFVSNQPQNLSRKVDVVKNVTLSSDDLVRLVSRRAESPDMIHDLRKEGPISSIKEMEVSEGPASSIQEMEINEGPPSSIKEMEVERPNVQHMQDSERDKIAEDSEPQEKYDIETKNATSVEVSDSSERTSEREPTPVTGILQTVGSIPLASVPTIEHSSEAMHLLLQRIQMINELQRLSALSALSVMHNAGPNVTHSAGPSAVSGGTEQKVTVIPGPVSSTNEMSGNVQPNAVASREEQSVRVQLGPITSTAEKSVSEKSGPVASISERSENTAATVKTTKKEKPTSGSKNKVKELKKEDKTRSKSPTTKIDTSASKVKEGTNSKTNQLTYGNITNINASVASSLKGKLLQSMMGNKPLNLSTTDRRSEESLAKHQPSVSS